MSAQMAPLLKAESTPTERPKAASAKAKLIASLVPQPCALKQEKAHKAAETQIKAEKKSKKTKQPKALSKKKKHKTSSV
ncbi:hypothetical protein ACT6QH_09055 [Xanthobacter sp. TB0139]|uniref:hypothetical protein n=1 Tax=Xanthobacter sp. TB0139 TaxID=3459178 RepID=UPI004039D077